MFEHPCEVCGGIAPWGYGANPLAQLPGRWRCTTHRVDALPPPWFAPDGWRVGLSDPLLGLWADPAAIVSAAFAALVGAMRARVPPEVYRVAPLDIWIQPVDEPPRPMPLDTRRQNAMVFAALEPTAVLFTEWRYESGGNRPIQSLLEWVRRVILRGQVPAQAPARPAVR